MATVASAAYGTWAVELEFAMETVRSAGAEIARFVNDGGAAVRAKGDESPVTDADIASDRIIRERVGAAFPGDALLTEEGADDPARLTVPRCWIADPLDGTQEFINGTGEFDVFLALAVEGVPVVAASCHPLSGRVLAAVAGAGAWLVDGTTRQPLRMPVEVGATPRLNTNRYHTRPAGWPLLRRVAERAGFVPPDIPTPFHPRAFFSLDGDGPAYEAHLGTGPVPGEEHAYCGGEWDMATPDLIIAEAGGLLTDLQGRRLRYNQPDPMIRHGLIAASSPALAARLATAYAEVSAEVSTVGTQDSEPPQ